MTKKFAKIFTRPTKRVATDLNVEVQQGETGQVVWTKRRHQLDRHSLLVCMLLVPGRGCRTH